MRRLGGWELGHRLGGIPPHQGRELRRWWRGGRCKCGCAGCAVAAHAVASPPMDFASRLGLGLGPVAAVARAATGLDGAAGPRTEHGFGNGLATHGGPGTCRGGWQPLGGLALWLASIGLGRGRIGRECLVRGRCHGRFCVGLFGGARGGPLAVAALFAKAGRAAGGALGGTCFRADARRGVRMDAWPRHLAPGGSLLPNAVKRLVQTATVAHKEDRPAQGRANHPGGR